MSRLEGEVPRGTTLLNPRRIDGTGNGKAGRMSEYEIVGPFLSHRVIVDGRRVPFLEAMPVNGGKISLLLDGRYSARPSRNARLSVERVSLVEGIGHCPWGQPTGVPVPRSPSSSCGWPGSASGGAFIPRDGGWHVSPAQAIAVAGDQIRPEDSPRGMVTMSPSEPLRPEADMQCDVPSPLLWLTCPAPSAESSRRYILTARH